MVLQDAYSHFGNELFYGNLTAAIGYLRRQQNLVKDMRSQAPKVADTRWESMSHVRHGLSCIGSQLITTLRLRRRAALRHVAGGFK